MSIITVYGTPTHTHRENTGMWKNTEFFSLPWVLPTSHQPPRQQLEHVGEDQLQTGMSSWISGEFGVWLSVFPAEFGRMEWEGTRLLERYSCTCPASPSTLGRHQSFHERSPCSGHFHRGRQGFPPSFDQELFMLLGFSHGRCQRVLDPVKHSHICSRPEQAPSLCWAGKGEGNGMGG